MNSAISGDSVQSRSRIRRAWCGLKPTASSPLRMKGHELHPRTQPKRASWLPSGRASGTAAVALRRAAAGRRDPCRGFAHLLRWTLCPDDAARRKPRPASGPTRGALGDCDRWAEEPQPGPADRRQSRTLGRAGGALATPSGTRTPPATTAPISRSRATETSSSTEREDRSGRATPAAADPCAAELLPPPARQIRVLMRGADRKGPSHGPISAASRRRRTSRATRSGGYASPLRMDVLLIAGPRLPLLDQHEAHRTK